MDQGQPGAFLSEAVCMSHFRLMAWRVTDWLNEPLA